MSRKPWAVWRGLVRRTSDWFRCSAGATTAEYALILALVVITLITTLSTLGATLNDKLRAIVGQISNAK